MERACLATRVRLAHRLRGPEAADPEALGFVAEPLYCVKFNAAAWYTLPRRVRRQSIGSPGTNPHDFGVGAVSFEGEEGLALAQVKWYAPGQSISSAADMKPSCIAGLAARAAASAAAPRPSWLSALVPSRLGRPGRQRRQGAGRPLEVDDPGERFAEMCISPRLSWG